MTPEALDQTLDAMEAAAASDQLLKPGLITVEANHWINTLGAIRPTCSALHDGLRHRNIKVVVSSAFETQVLTRAVAGDRGEPYRDLID